ncbi:MAG: hypothetical protein QGF74_00725 [Candidatus Nanoarchaeia archaeon]|jgi:hypothetical protein|nr:hypothetical protein [Candidatus Nanoarchaeia archaeon]|tara:strand:- start:1230 stop:2390 length:1161 start_codon:yes stop_codon:yes gene_type:complete
MAKKKELNLMSNYFNKNSATFQIVEQMRQEMLTGKRVKILEDIIEKAKIEVHLKRREIDESTYGFAYDLNNKIFGGFIERRVIMLISGVFSGDKEGLKHSGKNLPCIIPIDLGTNPHPLFKGQGMYPTIDTKVTHESTLKFLEENRRSLRQDGVGSFAIDSSKFFYFNEKEISRRFKKKRGEIDMRNLIPVINELPPYLFIDGMFVRTEKLIPSARSYEKKAVGFVSYRLKQSETQKLVHKLTFPEGRIDEKERLSDWVAHRIVFETEEELERAEDFFKENPTIGDSRIKYKYTKDYYKKPKINLFRSKNVVVEGRTKKYKPCIREVQLMHFPQFHYNYLDPNSPARHKQQKNLRKHISRKKRNSLIIHEGILQRIFEKDRIFIQI